MTGAAQLGFDHPWALLLIGACVLPLAGFGARWLGFASLLDARADRASAITDLVLRLLAAAPLALIALGLAGLHQRTQSVTRIGYGAHIFVVLDRSLSMDEPFALTGEKASESKTAAAARMIGDFFNRRPHDRFGLVAFSTHPLLAMPLTDHRDALAAAIGAMRGKALGNTDIGAGISYAMAQFEHDAPDAAHVILLVTDGAGEIPEQVRMYIQAEIERVRAHLYYLYLRAGDDPPLESGIDHDTNMTHPSALDGYFRSLGVPYQGFEARDAGAIEAATRRIAALETHPLTYTETVPRRALDRRCYGLAASLLALSLLAQLAERRVSLVAAA